MKRTKPVVALDGPAGAGKSSVARHVADELEYVLVDTGALYRGIALIAQERKIGWDEPVVLGKLARDLCLEFTLDSRLRIDGVERAEEIRTPEIGQGASKVSAYVEVRSALLDVQRKLGKEGGVVLEGRDIGTVVFPDAEVKIFLTASAEVRASRRMKELEGRGIQSNFKELLASMQERDARDASRDVAPLKPAEDSIVIDTTHLGLSQVVERIVEIVRKRRGAIAAESGSLLPR